jgi:hypothetical protein
MAVAPWLHCDDFPSRMKPAGELSYRRCVRFVRLRTRARMVGTSGPLGQGYTRGR